MEMLGAVVTQEIKLLILEREIGDSSLKQWRAGHNVDIFFLCDIENSNSFGLFSIIIVLPLQKSFRSAEAELNKG